MLQWTRRPFWLPQEYQRYRDAGAAHVLLDVRSTVQYGICALPGSVNVPLGELSAATVADLIRDKGVESMITK
jgi:rhodanese-related sulfurtransferase